MDRTPASQRRSWWLPVGLLLASLLSVALAPVFAQEGPPAEPLLPNTEPEVTAELQVAPGEEQAVVAALADYEANPAAAAALAELPAEALALTERLTFVPQLQRGRDVTLEPGQQPTPAPEPQPDRAADVAVTLWPNPSIIVRPGDLIVYTFTLRNFGRSEARETKVAVAYNRQLVTPVSTSLDSKAGDWLSELGQERYTVTFGPLAKGAQRVGRVVVRVSSSAPVRPSSPVIIDARGRYTWRDGNGSSERRTNWAPVVIGAGSVHGGQVPVTVTPPTGSVSTLFTFASDRFLPGEQVSAWVNVNKGSGEVRALNRQVTANSLGQVSIGVRGTDPSPDLPRGRHQIVLHGGRSALEGVIDFVVQ